MNNKIVFKVLVKHLYSELGFGFNEVNRSYWLKFSCSDAMRWFSKVLNDLAWSQMAGECYLNSKHLDYGGQELTTHLYNMVSGGRWHHNSAQCVTIWGWVCLSHIKDKLSTDKADIYKSLKGLCSGLVQGETKEP